MLTKQLADEIVEQTMVRLNRNLNVMDTNGMILASGEEKRINKIHEGAAFVAKTEEVLWITKENMAALAWDKTRCQYADSFPTTISRGNRHNRQSCGTSRNCNPCTINN